MADTGGARPSPKRLGFVNFDIFATLAPAARLWSRGRLDIQITRSLLWGLMLTFQPRYPQFAVAINAGEYGGGRTCALAREVPAVIQTKGISS
jgi:hypothetical protein